jgi:hypothetical protein
MENFMNEERENKDIISEEDYTMKMSASPSAPANDSPGDSEADAGAEFNMGFKFHPDNSESVVVEDSDESSDEELLPVRKFPFISSQKLIEMQKRIVDASVVYSD